jgi:thiamine biosynthesis lipoprotein
MMKRCFEKYVGLRNSLGLFFILFFLLGCEKEKRVISLFGRTMGTTYSIKYVPPSQKGFVSTDSIKSNVDELLQNLNQEMSTYRVDSDLSKINKSFDAGWISLPSRLFRVLKAAERVHKVSGGAFDMTVGPLINLWGFGPHGERKIPKEAVLSQIKKKVGHRLVELDLEAQRLKKENGVYIDLSAIAKGFGVDEVGRLLFSLGIKNYLVEIGGEIKTKGNKLGLPWRLAIEAPSKEERMIKKIVEVKDIAVATSGNYRNYFKSKGKYFSHTIDPRTGRPVEHRLASVTVFYPDSCMLADAYATALMVMGPEKGPQFAEKQGLLAYFVYGSKDLSTNGFREKSTTKLKQTLREFLP